MPFTSIQSGHGGIQGYRIGTIFLYFYLHEIIIFTSIEKTTHHKTATLTNFRSLRPTLNLFDPRKSLSIRQDLLIFPLTIPSSLYCRDLTSTGYANDVPGRHIFRIDEKVLPGVCIRDLSKYYRQIVRQKGTQTDRRKLDR